eukprot:5844767-Alexandrium_andersonii.AAC.1
MPFWPTWPPGKRGGPGQRRRIPAHPDWPPRWRRAMGDDAPVALPQRSRSRRGAGWEAAMGEPE